MKDKRHLSIFILVTMCLLVAVILGACSIGQNDEPELSPEPLDIPTPTPTQDPADTPPPPPEPTPVLDNDLVEWVGDVEHLFFHETIAYPDLAFPGRTDTNRLDDYMITAHEFKLILESLYRKNFILVDIHDVWSEYTDAQGQQRMQRSTLLIPDGKTPIILSFDDLTFHLEPYNAFMHRYIIGSDGEIWAEGIDPDGNPIVTQDLTAITILDKFIRENPGFSNNGAKGIIAQTGLFGILGYRTQSNINDNSDEFRLNRMQEIARAKPVIQRLSETGWKWATHSWGHIRNERASLEQIKSDAERWMSEVGSLIGETDIYIFAHGERLDGCDWRCTTACGPAMLFYFDLGFRFFASVGSSPHYQIKTDIAAVSMDRMASDGITLRGRREQFMRFYDAMDVFDPLRPDLGTMW